MHFVLSIATILVFISLALAVPVKDRLLIAEVKQAALVTEKSLLRLAMKHTIEIDDAIVNANVLDQFQIRQIRNHMEHSIDLLEKGNFDYDDMDNVSQSMSRILSLKSFTPTANKARLNTYTNGALDDITAKNLESANKEIRLFTYMANPKIKELTEATKQSEQELIMAFNNVTYAGLVSIEELFYKLLKVLEKY